MNDSSKAVAQLSGNDAYTKNLMNRVATGEATEAERLEFNEHIRKIHGPTAVATPTVTGAPSPSSAVPAAAPEHPWVPNVGVWPPTDHFQHQPWQQEQIKKHSLVGSQTLEGHRTTAEQNNMSDAANADYQLQLKLLEQQNKKRLLMARQEADDVHRTIPEPTPMPGATKAAGLPYDYQMQLMLLEQQNKKRLLTARQESAYERPSNSDQKQTPSSTESDPAKAAYHQHQELFEEQRKKLAATANPHWTPPSRRGMPNTANGPVLAASTMSQHALQDYQMQLMLLNQQNKRRSMLAAEAAASPQPPSYEAPIVQQYEHPVPAKGGNTALEDFQTQLKLLETQNKMRTAAIQTGKQVSNTTADAQSTAPPAPIQPCAMPAYSSPSCVIVSPTTVPPVPTGPELDATPKPKGKHRRVSVTDGSAEQLSQLSVKEKPAVKPKRAKLQAAKTKTQEEPMAGPRATREAASVYCKPFCDFMRENPTVFHAVDSQKKELRDLGWTELDERDKWDIVPGGKYFVERNGSSMLAFSVGENYKCGNGCAIIAGHVDALTAKVKPISEVPNKAGYLQLGVAPYAGGLNSTWWDRDLGIAGRVLIKEDDQIVSKLVKLDWPIARIPTLAPHFGAAAHGPFNLETQMVPIIGLEGTDTSASDVQASKPFSQPPILGGEKGPVGNFVNTQPPALVKAIGDALGLTTRTYANIVNWELELFDVQPATVGGLNKEFIYAGRLDDKLCSWAAMQALISGQQWNDTKYSSVIKIVGWFDNEEIGSKLRQGAGSNFLPNTIERVVGLLGKGKTGANLIGRTYANSFLVSSDVTHAVNPNFLGAYLENHAPHLNVGVAVAADPNGHMTTDAVSTSILQRCAESVGAKLQVFQIRNDSRSGGTIGPMLSAMTGIRAIDAGIPQLSMHSIRATTGSLDPGLGVITFMGFLNRFEHVAKEFLM